jgi:N utilization substance protein B
MALRRKAREYALQMMFQWELNHQETWRIESNFWKGVRAEKATRQFANQLFEGAVTEVKSCDAAIAAHARHWRLDRLAAMDRTILRLAIYELRCGETPHRVVINEAVELAKKFSDDQAPAFVNGILDAVRKALSADEPAPASHRKT